MLVCMVNTSTSWLGSLGLFPNVYNRIGLIKTEISILKEETFGRKRGGDENKNADFGS